MSTQELRRDIKKPVDRLDETMLETLADFVTLLGRVALLRRIAEAEKEIRQGKGTPWREISRDLSDPF